MLITYNDYNDELEDYAQEAVMEAFTPLEYNLYHNPERQVDVAQFWYRPEQGSKYGLEATVFHEDYLKSPQFARYKVLYAASHLDRGILSETAHEVREGMEFPRV